MNPSAATSASDPPRPPPASSPTTARRRSDVVRELRLDQLEHSITFNYRLIHHGNERGRNVSAVWDSEAGQEIAHRLAA